MKRILITGAAGFIGRYTLPLLTDYDIHAVSRQPQQASDTIHWHPIDLLDNEQVSHLMQDVQPTHLLHFAWDVDPANYRHSLLNYQWVSATLHLLQQFHLVGGQRAVLAGTCFEYNLEAGFCSEDKTPLVTDMPYTACKSSLFHLATSYAQQVGLSLAWGRIFYLYGAEEKPQRFIPYIIQTLLNGQVAKTSHGEQYRDFLYVHDVASAFVALLNSDVTGAVNIASGEPVRLKDIIHQIADRLDARHLVQLGARPANHEPPMIVADVQRLKQEVGWKPHYSLADGLAKTVQWWQSQQKVNP